MLKNRHPKLRLLVSFGIAMGLLFPSVSNFTPASAQPDSNHDIGQADSLWVVVNKARPLNPLKYKPVNLVVVGSGGVNFNPYQKTMRKDAAMAAVELVKAAAKLGRGRLVLQSGYRSYAEQDSVHTRQVSRYGKTKGEALAARPGYSEHQTGLAMDVSARGQGCQIRVCFGETKAGSWLAKNAYKYGFIIRYQNGATPITGYQYEPWHLRYIGVEVATDMHNKKIHTLEQYFKLPAAPKYP